MMSVDVTVPNNASCVVVYYTVKEDMIGALPFKCAYLGENFPSLESPLLLHDIGQLTYEYT